MQENLNLLLVEVAVMPPLKETTVTPWEDAEAQEDLAQVGQEVMPMLSVITQVVLAVTEEKQTKRAGVVGAVVRHRGWTF